MYNNPKCKQKCRYVLIKNYRRYVHFLLEFQLKPYFSGNGVLQMKGFTLEIYLIFVDATKAMKSDKFFLITLFCCVELTIIKG